MKLIDLLVRDLPGMGGWRDGFLYASQDKCGRVFLYEQKPYISDGFCYWEEAGYTSFYHASRAELSDDWNTAVVTREQYEAALAAASKPEAEVKKIIGKFTSTLKGRSDFRKEFYVKTVQLHSHFLYTGEMENGEEYEVQKEFWDFEPVWDGEGLPPAGCNCFVSCEDHADHEWIKIKVVHVHNGEVIGVVDMPGESIHDQISKYSKDYNKAFFIPMPTEAERKREAAVDKILELMDIDRESPTRWGLDKIYNWIAEGKIPGVRLEDEAGR